MFGAGVSMEGFVKREALELTLKDLGGCGPQNSVIQGW